MLRLGADFGYTLDGGQRGVLEGESFSADACEVVFTGISAHPGYAKNKMVSAIKVAAHFIDLLPKNTMCPEMTEGQEGFVHPLHIEGTIEKARVKFILRDFKTDKLDQHFEFVCQTAASAVKAFPGAAFSTERVEQYRNMKEILDEYPQVMDNAATAYRLAGLEPRLESIRGGTDGSRLSFMGLPCPNIFTGEMAIHSRVEYVSVQDMEKAVEVLHHLCQTYLAKA
jgi:tripeptide aminopeptidase